MESKRRTFGYCLWLGWLWLRTIEKVPGFCVIASWYVIVVVGVLFVGYF